MDKSRKYEENRLIIGVKLANLRIYETAQREARYRGMGTTIVSLLLIQDWVYLSHVGDSRIYRIRGGAIEQMTEDHSLLNDYIKMKKLTPEEIENFPHKNVIVRALGMKDVVKVDLMRTKPKNGDVFLLCSDGLSGMCSDEELLEICLEYPDLAKACHALIDRANQHGGTDNVTVVLCRYVGDDA